MEEIIFQLILHSGNAKSCAIEAIAKAKTGEFAEADALIEEANKAFHEAHLIQTDLITAEIRGEKFELNLLMVHAQDHLMTAMTTRDLALEIIDLYKRLGG